MYPFKIVSNEVKWNGPYSWLSFEVENNLPPNPKPYGVYLQTFEYQNGYLIYTDGLTRRSIFTLFSEHTRKYMIGEYNALAIAAAQREIRIIYYFELTY